jgi:signal transduction histidine kinase
MALPPHATLQILRVAQEALTNVVKHSGARHVDISLRYLDGTLTLAICDDGIGAGAARSPSGRGMRNMRARTAQLGGALAVGEGDGRGTRIVLTLDCPPPAPGA